MLDFTVVIEGGDDAILAFIQNRLGHFFPRASVSSTAGSGTTVALSPRCPLFDPDLVSQMVKASEATGHSFRATDAIPGTEPIYVGDSPDDLREFFWTTQNRYCTNFNVGRPNRRKIFNEMVRRFADLHTWDIDRLTAFLESEEGVDFVVAYGEPVALERVAECPSCDTEIKPQPLRSGTSHPITGFLTKNVSVYSHCLNCGLTFLNRQMPKAELWRYYQEHSYENPLSPAQADDLLDNLSEANVSHYANYTAVMEYVRGVEDGGWVGDIGAGRGEYCVMAKAANPSAKVIAYDWRVAPVLSEALARRGVEAVSGDFETLLPTDGRFALLSAWEVIEHLRVSELPGVLASIRRALRPGGHFIFSTPDFNNPYARALDFWAMAPGEHLSVLSRRYLEPLLSRAGFEIVEEMHESVTLKRPNDWFAFGAGTDVHFSSKANCGLIDEFLSDDLVRDRVRANARAKNQGSELILVCKALA